MPRHEVIGHSGRPLVGVSACLLGHDVRYDGRCRLNLTVSEGLAAHCDLVPVCPEVEFGLSVPRDPIGLFRSGEDIRLLTVQGHFDLTESMTEWTRTKLDELAELELDGFVFKARSPSCALASAEILSMSGEVLNARGTGLFTKFFRDRFPGIPVEDEQRLSDPTILTDFISRLNI